MHHFFGFPCSILITRLKLKLVMSVLYCISLNPTILSVLQAAPSRSSLLLCTLNVSLVRSNSFDSLLLFKIVNKEINDYLNHSISAPKSCESNCWAKTRSRGSVTSLKSIFVTVMCHLWKKRNLNIWFFLSHLFSITSLNSSDCLFDEMVQLVNQASIGELGFWLVSH